MRHAVSFRFREDAGAAVRRDGLLRALASCRQCWTDGERLAVVETDEGAAALEERLYLDSTLNALKDWLLVLPLAEGAAPAARGRLVAADGLRRVLPLIAVAEPPALSASRCTAADPG